ncbi:type III pantothenate kinase [Myxococcota bacterium]|nr:type III pantothenate kinase [Myxococcota bacterium]MBU1430691.1 type III pantothenate kinase [Myxococcota bacterium]MBU1899489.1 type III pantothenate kinase [Myxococcota bacterium]
MLLAIDLGNTQTVVGLFNEGQLVDRWRIATNPKRTMDEIGLQLRMLFSIYGSGTDITEAILSSVVPTLTDTWVRMSRRYFGVRCRVVGPGLKTGMPILYDNPHEVGADRIVNAVAAYQRYHCGLIVVDLGTATTLDVVTPKGEYLGGAICPGVRISNDALFDNAARLPRVEFAKPRSAIGRNTVHSVQAGMYYGYVSLIDGLVTRMRAELSFPCKVIATGGLASSIADDSETIEEVDELLTLEGLWLLAERNAQ